MTDEKDMPEDAISEDFAEETADTVSEDFVGEPEDAVSEDLTGKPERKNNKTKKIIVALLIILAIAGAFFGIYRYLTGYGESVDKMDKARKQWEKENAINGHWQAEDEFVADVWRDEKGRFHALISLSDNDNTVTYWEMSGWWTDDVKGFKYKDAKKTIVEYDAKGNENSTIKYDEGKGKVFIKRGKLYWNDEEENASGGKSFVYIGEY